MGVQRSRTADRPKSTLMVRLDKESKAALAKAAALRKVSISDYVRTVTVPQARKDIAAAHDQTISLTPAEQLAFWTALNEPAELTPAQRELGKLMRVKL
jgi:uncharacterized protein (DUF1778 family)